MSLALRTRTGARRPPAAAGCQVRSSAAGGSCARPHRGGGPRPPPDPITRRLAGSPDRHPLDLAGDPSRLAKQRCRLPRIRLPESDPGVNRWGLVGQTYQPELATAWSACTQAFGEESDQDPVFEQSCSGS